jgi:16S rRNA G1207 methylase RsmC
MPNSEAIKIERFPLSRNNSLQAWSAADEYLVKYWNENKKPNANLAIYNDRYGYMASLFNEFNPISVIDFKSQEKAIKHNLEKNGLEFNTKNVFYPLDTLPKPLDFVFIKIPKSLDLFKLYLSQVSKASNENTIVVCAFMTKNFSPQFVKIGAEYFSESEQSLAKKKARLLLFKKPLPAKKTSLLNTIVLNKEESLQQYFGVFSAHNIDYATQFLLQSIELNTNDKEILDLASGNGVIAYHIANSYKIAGLETPEIHLVDDSYLAVESSKLNLKGENFHFYFNDNIEEFKNESLDLIVTNPPFHFDYEINTETTFNLFYQSKAKLSPTGRLVIVANRHLNYRSFLKSLFSKIETIGENPKFVVLECFKKS